jgi:hypothetical protein
MSGCNALNAESAGLDNSNLSAGGNLNLSETLLIQRILQLLQAVIGAEQPDL